MNKRNQKQFPLNCQHPNFTTSIHCSEEMRRLVAEERVAFRGLFTSGIKSAHDIETSGWTKLSQGAGTKAGIAPTTQPTEINPCYIRAK